MAKDKAKEIGEKPADGNLARMTATEAAEAIRAGRITSEALVGACLDRIAALEERVGAWAFLDPGHALKQAREADRARREGKALGPLHGVPVGIKDIFDTKDMPTENGTVLHAGRRPAEDAAAVSLLRDAGAVILGKTVTTELAVYSPGKTRNPHDPERTPGGSSSGSAAAVAAFMAPLAIGTQTNGSVIRPASYCGVYGYKPSYGLISRHRVLRQSPPLDQVGVFARTVEDAALVAERIMGFDDRDPGMRPGPRPALVGTLAEEPPFPPRLAFVKTPVWGQADMDTQEAFAALVARLGEIVVEIELPEMFRDAVAIHRTIMEADLAGSLRAGIRAGEGTVESHPAGDHRAGTEGAGRGVRPRAAPGAGPQPRARPRCSSGTTPSSHPPPPARPPSAWNRREARYFARSGPCAGCRRSRFPSLRAHTACRWACSWSGPKATTPGCCGRPAGW